MSTPAARIFLGVLYVLTSAVAPTSYADTYAGDDAAKQEEIDRLYSKYKKRWFEDVPDIDVRGAKKLLDKHAAILVDTRTEEERMVSILPGAISKAAYEENPDAHKQKIIIPYCTIGARSGKYAKELVDRGIPVKNLKGSILSWAHAGYLFEKDGAPSRKAHVYGATWDLLPEGYEPVF